MATFKVVFEKGLEIAVHAPDEAAVRAHVERVAEAGRARPVVGREGFAADPSRGEMAVAKAGAVRSIERVK